MGAARSQVNLTKKVSGIELIRVGRWVVDHAAPTLPHRRLMLLVSAYFVFVAIGLSRHEMWGDEMQAWMLARNSGSIPELLHNMRYEGHPAAWHLILFLLSRFTPDPVAMQVLHLALATGTIFVVVRWSPFTALQKTLLVFGYFFIYEYAVISRAYVLGALALFCACAAFPLRKRSYLPLALPIVLLANTSVYGLFLAFALSAMLLVERRMDRHFRAGFAGSRWDPLLALVLVVVGGVAAAAQMIPPSDAALPAIPSAEALQWSPWRAAHSLSTVWRAYVPVPLLSTPHNWDTNLLADGGYWSLLAAVLLSAALLTGTVLLLARTPYALLLFILGSGGIIAFTYLRYVGSTRHYGHIFLLLIASVWIARVSSVREGTSRSLRAIDPRVPSWGNPWLTGVLVTQVAAGGIVYQQDLWKPFSAAQETAGFLRQSRLGAIPMAGSPPLATTALAGYLDRSVFFLDHERFGTFVVWGESGTKAHSAEEMMERARSLLTSVTPVLLLVLNDSLPEGARGGEIRPVAHFGPGIVQGEQYYLYLMRRHTEQQTSARTPGE